MTGDRNVYAIATSVAWTVFANENPAQSKIQLAPGVLVNPNSPDGSTYTDSITDDQRAQAGVLDLSRDLLGYVARTL